MGSDPDAEPKASVVLVGTIHGYQLDLHGWNRRCGAPQFEQYLIQFVSEHKVDSLLEELNEEALTDVTGRAKSWLENIAKKTGILHRFIDPGIEDRSSIGILTGEYSTPESNEKRERYWIERVRELKFSTALCVVGCAHIDSFSSKLAKEYECVIENACYNPEELEVS